MINTDITKIISDDDRLNGLNEELGVLSGTVHFVSVSELSDRIQLGKLAEEGNVRNTRIIIDAHLADPTDPLLVNAGIDLACCLRRNFLFRGPIVLVSHLPKTVLKRLSRADKKYEILSAFGTTFLQIPATTIDIASQLQGLSPIDEEQLRTVILEHCDLWNRWALAIHIIERLLRDEDVASIAEELDAWRATISFLRPDLVHQLAELEIELTNKLQGGCGYRGHLSALQKFGRSLFGTSRADESSADDGLNEITPNAPPKGFSKLLIVDDNPQDFLASTLRSEFRYDVIPTQATTLKQAKDLLDEHDPDVVLADLYFKETNSLTEVPKKAVGEKFQKYAVADSRRLVVVTSKAPIRSTDLLSGTINSCGKTSASEIHQAIWKAAATRGVTETETIDGREWGPELTSRQRLEPYEVMLPKIIEQWSLFPQIITETLNLAVLLKNRARDSDQSLVEELVQVLQSHEGLQDFSTRSIRDLFSRTKKIHEQAKMGAETMAKHDIRNILHGKVEQSSSVLNAVDQTLSVVRNVAKTLNDLPRYSKLGDALNVLVSNFSENADLLPFLNALNTALVKVLDSLPPLPVQAGTPAHFKSVGRRFRILIVEDNPYWRAEAEDVCEKLAKDYLGHHEFVLDSFDNAVEALSALSPRNPAHVIAREHVETTNLAILDICIPKDPEHSHRIQDAASGKLKSFCSPQSSRGLELIRTLSEFNYNVPIIVFSTIDSINDRIHVCGWGIPEANFISKGPNAQEYLRSALIRLIEKSNKYIVARHILGEVDRFDGSDEEEINDSSETSVFYINGLKIAFPPALFNTFTAIYDLCQRTGERTFTVDDLISEKGYGTRKEIHDHINRIRARLFETAHRNRVYLNVHEIIRSFSFPGGETKYGYQFNADIPTLDEEYLDPWNEDREELALRRRVLLIGNDPAFADISAVLRNQSFEVTEWKNNMSSDHDVHPFDSDVVVISTNVGDPSTQWKSIKGASLEKDVGVLFISETDIDPMLVNELVQVGVPLNNLVSTSSSNWLSNFLQAFENERIRVFVGDAPDLAKDHSFPVVEIQDGTDVDAGILNLLVDERPFQMGPRDNGVLSQILGQLLASPGQTLSWPELESSAALQKSPTKNNKKSWPSRLRKEVIAKKWVDPTDDNPIERAKLILESSSEGLRLNVRTIDVRISA